MTIRWNNKHGRTLYGRAPGNVLVTMTERTDGQYNGTRAGVHNFRPFADRESCERALASAGLWKKASFIPARTMAQAQAMRESAQQSSFVN